MKQKISLVIAVIFVGVFAGLGAAFLSWLIHAIEQLAFGHSEKIYPIVTNDTTPQRRIIAMLIGGGVVTLGWWWLQTKVRPVLSISAMIKGEKPSAKANICHALLQIVAVGSGAPVGREVAPRELGALFAGHVADWFRINPEMRTVLIACGAAAGLAAVYHVPFAGAIFALEILLGAFSVRNATIAFAVSAIAVLVARIEISPETFYQVGQIDDSLAQTLWAGGVGLAVGVPAILFRKIAKQAEANRCQKSQVLWAMPLAFLITAIIAIWLPQILGNGRSAAQTAFWGMTIVFCFVLLVAKTSVVLLTLRSGVYGGTLTPGLAIGALAGLLIGLFAQIIVPETDLLVATLAGSAGFLAVSMNAPFTAFALIVGFTGQGFDSYLPLSLAIAGAFASSQLLRSS